MRDITAAQWAAMQAVLDAVRPAGGGQSGIETDVLRTFARDEPEAAAAGCQAMLLAAQENKGYGGLAVALAAAYQEVFNDDTLNVLVRDHYAELGQPVPDLRFADDAPPRPAPLQDLGVPQEALERCDIYPLLKVFSRRHLADGESAGRLRDLGGRLRLSFPIPDSDPRYVWEVPSVRAYVRALADAMPYFPYYLAADPRLRMFEVYFGSLVDPALLKGGIFDLSNDEIFVVVRPTLLATEQFADAVGADGEACVRALLAGFPPESADWMVHVLRNAAQRLQPESSGE